MKRITRVRTTSNTLETARLTARTRLCFPSFHAASMQPKPASHAPADMLGRFHKAHSRRYAVSSLNTRQRPELKHQEKASQAFSHIPLWLRGCRSPLSGWGRSNPGWRNPPYTPDPSQNGPRQVVQDPALPRSHEAVSAWVPAPASVDPLAPFPRRGPRAGHCSPHLAHGGSAGAFETHARPDISPA